MQLSDSAIVEAAYAAALDDGLWHDWTISTAESLGGVGGTFWVMDVKDVTVERFALLGRPEGMIDGYFRDWGDLDPQVSFVSGFTRSRIYTSGDHVDLGEPGVAAYVDWQKRVGLVDHHLATALALDDRRYMGGISIHRALNGGPAPRADRDRLARLSPELQRAFRLGFRENRMLADAYWRGLTEADQRPALLVDEIGRVSHTSPAAAALFSSQSDITVRDRRLVCADPALEERLRAMIGRAIGATSAVSGAVRVPLQSGATPIFVAYPLAWKRRALAPFEAAALVRIVMPSARASSDAVYAQAFDLTPREADLARLLMAGHSVESAAAEMGIRMTTARVHLRRVFDKTGTARQTDLVRLLARF